jgi:hypothetical protein
VVLWTGQRLRSAVSWNCAAMDGQHQTAAAHENLLSVNSVVFVHLKSRV